MSIPYGVNNRQPNVGDLLEVRERDEVYYGLINEEFYMGRDSYACFRILWNGKKKPRSYNHAHGLYSINICNDRRKFKFFRDGVEQ